MRGGARGNAAGDRAAVQNHDAPSGGCQLMRRRQAGDPGADDNGVAAEVFLEAAAFSPQAKPVQAIAPQRLS